MIGLMKMVSGLNIGINLTLNKWSYLMNKPSYVGFEHDKYPWKPDIDYRKNPHLYKIGRGQQGVLICEPYKSELYPLWKFKTPNLAKQSCNMIIITIFFTFKLLFTS